MPHLASHSNVYGTCFALLTERGYTLSLASDLWEADMANCYYRMEREGFVLLCDDPLQLLALAALRETAYAHTVSPDTRWPTPGDTKTTERVFQASLPGLVFHPPFHEDDTGHWNGNAVLPPVTVPFPLPDTAAAACLNIFNVRGYSILLRAGPDKNGPAIWIADADGIEFWADDPIQLFGLTTIYEYHHSPREPLEPYWWRVNGWHIWDAMLAARWPDIRPATSADAPAIATLYLESRKTFLPYAPPAHTDAEIREWIAQKMLPTREVFVAENTGGIIGFIALSRTPESTWIDHLYLHPGATGHTVGSQLLTQSLAAAPRPVRLYTFQANTRARRFYERHGFHPIAFSDGSNNEEHCPDVLYELGAG